ncbi:hypothetical protein Tco_0169192 [Tanacetum coccineum]
MAEEQVIVYAPQWNNMTMDDVLGENYSSTKQVNSIQQLLAYCIIIGTEVDIGEIIYSDLVTKLLNKSMLKYVSYARFISCALQVLLGYDYTQDGSVHDPQDPERNIQLTGTGLPSILDEGTCKSQPFPEGTTTDPKDSGGNIQPANKGLPSTASNEGTAKTTPRPEGPLGDKDSGETNHPLIWNQSTPLLLILQALVLTQESEEAILGAGDEIDEDSQTTALQHQSSPPQANKPQSSHALDTEASDTHSSSEDLLTKYDNTFPLTEQQLVKYLRKVPSTLFPRIIEDHWEKHEEAAVYYANLKASIDDYYNENITHKDHTDKLVEATMSSLDQSNTATSDLYKGL